MSNGFILGGGVTGLAAGIASGFPILEAANGPGGICSSYYLRPGDKARLEESPSDGEAYRFELGGGHWLFGQDPAILKFMSSLTPMDFHVRKSAVYFRNSDQYVEYPLQDNLRMMDPSVRVKALAEMARPGGGYRTMKDWLRGSFGPTLCDLFFYPFHELYTNGLYHEIAPQDAYKSPVDLAVSIQGALSETAARGYNVTFGYPTHGLNALVRKMADRCRISYGKRVVAIDPVGREVRFADGSTQGYDLLLSTLPLNEMLTMTNLKVDARTDPHTAVLVLNIGAVRGERCPDQHWLYNPDATSGFHRVGFYSNVDRSFLPRSARADNNRVSIYVERAYQGARPSEAHIASYSEAVVRELQDWGYIKEAEIVDPTWIDVAYTWAWPGSPWKRQAMAVLEQHGIYQVGRYGRWVFQGIGDSIRDGFFVGTCLKDKGSAA